VKEQAPHRCQSRNWCRSLSTYGLAIEAEPRAAPRLLPVMLDLLDADDVDLAPAGRTAGDSIKISGDDLEFSACFAKSLVGLTHAEDLQRLRGQFILRRNLLNDIRTLSGQGFEVLLDRSRGGKKPWRILVGSNPRPLTYVERPGNSSFSFPITR
jgi:hypothetical protein